MRSKLLLGVGALLVILGIAGLILKRISYTTQEDVVRVGPVQAAVETKKITELPPLLCGLVLAGGVLLVFLGWQKKS